MCPSYLATKDEKDSTRGRARVLQELANGTLIAGFDSPEVAESLDLCLACKACGSDCPAGVDMATYKSEVLYRKHHECFDEELRDHAAASRPKRGSHGDLAEASRRARIDQHRDIHRDDEKQKAGAELQRAQSELHGGRVDRDERQSVGDDLGPDPAVTLRKRCRRSVTDRRELRACQRQRMPVGDAAENVEGVG